ncbi:hypothetical protein CGGC5_v000858 [Colletotrichum fructicola Nara gc5]|uniref:Uncharacterized protein n=1 Tax=Colletotrichum fructicola (strain Nara gc5) TaxID=1213859 RepID=A0A7J6JQY6_COLFN|nr:hypothetical protein CGGC5_v000858 [Colletotrichum fructicola Nara gc5]
MGQTFLRTSKDSVTPIFVHLIASLAQGPLWGITASRKGEAERDRSIAQSQAVQLHQSRTGRRGGAWLTRPDCILSASREPPEISNKLAKAVSVKTRREPSVGLSCLARGFSHSSLRYLDA